MCVGTLCTLWFNKLLQVRLVHSFISFIMESECGSGMP